MRVEIIASGLEHPWGVALLPEGGFLITERPGRLRRIAADGTLSAPISGVPPVFAQGQGGLLDVVLDPGYTSNKRIWLSFAEPGEGGTAGTAVATATLGDATLTDLQVIYRQLPKLEGGNHFGSRIAFDGKGHVFISQGERNERAMAQDLDVLQGKLVRLNLDGTQPADNPFANGVGVRKAIFSYGHRNMQGMAVDPRTGTLWQSEHGPRGGDELNLPQPGRNYGWPVITHGINYSGLKIPEAEGKAKPGMEQPHHFWEKSPGLSGMAFYTGRPGSAWSDSLLLGALADRNLIRLTPGRQPHRVRGTPAGRPRQAHPRCTGGRRRQSLRADRRGRWPVAAAGAAGRAGRKGARKGVRVKFPVWEFPTGYRLPTGNFTLPPFRTPRCAAA